MALRSRHDAAPCAGASRLALEVGAAPSSHALTARIAHGDEQAFATFYDLWFDRLFALARRSTGRDDAFCLDAVQDCMLKVVHKLPALPDDDAVAAWLVRALLRGAVDRLRADARRARREQAVASTRDAAGGDSTPDLLPDLLDAEQRAWLAARVAELPPADRALLQARFADGHTLHAAGAAAGLSGHAAHGRIRRLLLRLRAAAKEIFDV